MVTDLCCTTFCPKPAASDFKSDRHICHIYLILGLSTWKLQIKATPSLSWQIGYSRINMTTRFNYLHKWDIRFTICSLRPSMTRHRWVLAAWLWIRGAPWLLPRRCLSQNPLLDMSPQVELANTNVTQLPSGCHQKLCGRRLPCRQKSCSDSASLFHGKRSNTSSQGNTTDTASLLRILAECSCPRTIQNPNNYAPQSLFVSKQPLLWLWYHHILCIM